jgi:hypothetical protein
MWVVGVNSKILGRLRQTRRVLMKQSSRSLSSTLDWGHEGRICEVLQKDGRSSMYKAMIHNYAVERSCLEFFLACCPWLIMIIPWFANQTYNTDRCLFSQVKNKPWLPWVYSWIRHRHEHIEHIRTNCNTGMKYHKRGWPHYRVMKSYVV